MRTLSTKETLQVVRYLFLLYSQVCLEPTRERHAELIHMIDAAVAVLPQEQRRIIVNEFMHPQGHDWWREYYSRSTYYRLRADGINRLFVCLHR